MINCDFHACTQSICLYSVSLYIELINAIPLRIPQRTVQIYMFPKYYTMFLGWILCIQVYIYLK